jgi:hypothetical protein
MGVNLYTWETSYIAGLLVLTTVWHFFPHKWMYIIRSHNIYLRNVRSLKVMVYCAWVPKAKNNFSGCRRVIRLSKNKKKSVINTVSLSLKCSRGRKGVGIMPLFLFVCFTLHNDGNFDYIGFNGQKVYLTLTYTRRCEAFRSIMMGMLKVYCQIYVWNEGHSSDRVWWKTTHKLLEIIFLLIFLCYIHIHTNMYTWKDETRRIRILSIDFWVTWDRVWRSKFVGTHVLMNGIFGLKFYSVSGDDGNLICYLIFSTQKIGLNKRK